MKHLQTRAFVLRTVDYGERDTIVTLLGRDCGRFSAIARSAKTSRRRFGGGLQPLRCLQASYTTRPQRELATLTEVKVVVDYPGIETDLEKIALACYATELVREVCREGDEASATFDLLEDFYGHLSRESALAQAEVTLRHFELRLLEIHGAAPSLAGCARCGLSTQAGDKYMCSRVGDGLICSGCRHQGEAVGVLEPNALYLLRGYLTLEPLAAALLADASARMQARRVIEASLAQIIERELRSRAMLTTLGLA
ncbi:MAG: DNA repair protein RecO [Bradymonadaceae bacterium]|nr:DNA repair protein RecO [Lujinxingiaceae bacterium]